MKIIYLLTICIVKLHYIYSYYPGRAYQEIMSFPQSVLEDYIPVDAVHNGDKGGVDRGGNRFPPRPIRGKIFRFDASIKDALRDTGFRSKEVVEHSDDFLCFGRFRSNPAVKGRKKTRRVTSLDKWLRGAGFALE